jgi:hypothetical protein
MSCGKCAKRSNCKEICKEVEALLPRPQAGHKNKIKHYAPDVLERLATESAFRLKFGGRKQPNIGD